MAALPKPERPLSILTIDGGGLQAISTLTVLQQLLDEITNNKPASKKKLRPCDVFDVICGIGTGGWLALLLGRFQMDVATCFMEWYNLMQAITPQSKTEEMRMRFLHRSYFDPNRLVRQVERLTKLYGTGNFLMINGVTGSRCRHVFVSALKIDSNHKRLEYNLLRTYQCPKGVKLLEGPENPESYPISSAFGATGAAKYFTPPWKEHSAKFGKLKFSDVDFPKPHNITNLALNEIWALYGKDVAIRIVVNIGPGLPSDSDIRKLARRVSWGSVGSSRSSSLSQSSSRKMVTFSKPVIKTLEPSAQPSPPTNQGMDLIKEAAEPKESESYHVQYEQTKPVPASTEEPFKARPLPRFDTFGSATDVGIDKALKRDEKAFEKHIREKLKFIYPLDPPPYVRLGVDKAPEGTSLNDTCFPDASFNNAVSYIPSVQDEMKKIGRTIDFPVAPAA